MESTKIALFKGKQIRKTLYNNEWWFVIVDVIDALTDTVQPDGYIKDMRRRDPELAKGWGQIATPLSIQTEGGKQKMNCADTEGIFRIINQFLHVKQNHLSDGWQKLVMSVCKKLKIPNWLQSEQEFYTSSKVIPMIGPAPLDIIFRGTFYIYVLSKIYSK